MAGVSHNELDVEDPLGIPVVLIAPSSGVPFLFFRQTLAKCPFFLQKWHTFLAGTGSGFVFPTCSNQFSHMVRHSYSWLWSIVLLSNG